VRKNPLSTHPVGGAMGTTGGATLNWPTDGKPAGGGGGIGSGMGGDIGTSPPTPPSAPNNKGAADGCSIA
jgi:hypothetical protein